MKLGKSLIVLVVLMAAGTAAGSPQTSVNVEKVEPVQPAPGDTVKMFLVVRNQGDSGASYQPLSVETTEGVKFTGTTSNFRDSFSLCGGCQTTGTLYFKVSEDAETGSYPIDVEAKSGEVGVVGKFTLEVKGKPEILLESSNVKAVPGEKSSFNLSIRNVGTGKASQLVLRHSTEKFLVEPSKIFIESLEPGEKLEKRMTVKPEKDLESEVKDLNFDLGYSQGPNRTVTSEKVAVEILEKADMTVSGFEVSEKKLGKKTQLTAEIENLGPGEAEKIEAALECNGASVHSSKDFVGLIDSDESIPVSFSITPEKQKVECSLEVKYSDHTRKSLSQDFSFSAGKKSSPVIPAAIGLLLLAGIVLFWRKRRKDELEEI